MKKSTNERAYRKAKKKKKKLFSRQSFMLFLQSSKNVLPKNKKRSVNVWIVHTINKKKKGENKNGRAH